MSSTTVRALSGYRRLFRARNKLFHGDLRALAESRIAIRAEFNKNRVVSDPYHLEGLLVMIDEAEDMMLHGIVQGKLNEKGNYGTCRRLNVMSCGKHGEYPNQTFYRGQGQSRTR
jgi:complex III assembly factor LYRM7